MRLCEKGPSDQAWRQKPAEYERRSSQTTKTQIFLLLFVIDYFLSTMSLYLDMKKQHARKLHSLGGRGHEYVEKTDSELEGFFGGRTKNNNNSSMSIHTWEDFSEKKGAFWEEGLIIIIRIYWGGGELACKLSNWGQTVTRRWIPCTSRTRWGIAGCWWSWMRGYSRRCWSTCCGSE